MTIPTSELLYLSSHVRACEIDGVVILLDLRRNKYVGISKPLSQMLACHVKGWPKFSGVESEQSNVGVPTTVTAPLLLQGLLTHAVTSSSPRPSVPEATSSLDLDAEVGTRVGARRVARFLQSAALTALRLRCQSLESIATAVASRRSRLERSKSHAASQALTRGMAAYEWLRPFAFAARDNCLYDSLAVVDFLVFEGVFPRWVVGVKTSPFAAHSWVQCDALIVNDLHENVRRFRPILVV